MAGEGTMKLLLQSQTLVRNSEGCNVWQLRTIGEQVRTNETAILICDMWDRHWSRGAQMRAAELAKRIHHVVKIARGHGVHIIHAPSDTTDFYKDSPARKRLLQVPKVEPPAAKILADPPSPIDSSDGGSDTGETKQEAVWSRQSSTIGIDEELDVIAGDEGGLVYNYLWHKGIKKLLIMGVHTNMCILNRTFGIKQMSRWGIECVLVKDLTDTMYNPARPPYVSHEEGTRLIVEYIEKFWCPTVDSEQLLHSFS